MVGELYDFFQRVLWIEAELNVYSPDTAPPLNTIDVENQIYGTAKELNSSGISGKVREDAVDLLDYLSSIIQKVAEGEKNLQDVDFGGIERKIVDFRKNYGGFIENQNKSYLDQIPKQFVSGSIGT